MYCAVSRSLRSGGETVISTTKQRCHDGVMNEDVSSDAEVVLPTDPAPQVDGETPVESLSAEVVTASDPAPNVEEEVVSEPGKVMRIGSMIKQLLEEVRQAPLDERSRIRLREIYEVSIRELSSSLSTDLRQELESLALPFGDEAPSDAELRIAQAQLVGWLEGLFHGIQAAIFAQQMAAQAQLQQMRQMGQMGQMGLPPGVGAGEGGAMSPGPGSGRPPGGGTYL